MKTDKIARERSPAYGRDKDWNSITYTSDESKKQGSQEGRVTEHTLH